LNSKLTRIEIVDFILKLKKKDFWVNEKEEGLGKKNVKLLLNSCRFFTPFMFNIWRGNKHISRVYWRQFLCGLSFLVKEVWREVKGVH